MTDGKAAQPCRGNDDLAWQAVLMRQGEPAPMKPEGCLGFVLLVAVPLALVWVLVLTGVGIDLPLAGRVAVAALVSLVLGPALYIRMRF